MTASLNKISAGDGYLYLTRQVAAHDVNRGETSLADYYAEKGESPGRWMGAGLAGLGEAWSEFSVPAGSVVEEHQMVALFGSGRHPEHDGIYEAAKAAGLTEKQGLRESQLGRVFQDGSTGEFNRQLAEAYRDWNLERGNPTRAEIPEEVRAGIRTKLALKTFVQAHGREPLSKQEFDGHLKRETRGEGRRACAGFDVTFSPVKSISALWAVAPRDVAKVMEAAQEEAVNEAIGWLEKEMAFTRRGMRGVRQVETNGLMAAAFVHRDSRAGDPDLHTHVAISNKVQAREDGAWLALDGRQIYQATVAVSERYNSSMERILARDLGLRFVDRESDSGRRSIREVEGIDETLMTAWSKRRTAINTAQKDLVQEFEARHNRPPTPVETLALAQQATLDTRQEKHEPRSYAEQREQWRQEAAEVLGGAEVVDQMAQGALGRTTTFAVMDDDLVEQVAAEVVHVVETNRASWQLQHVLAEAERQARTVGVSDANYRPLVEQVTAKVLGDAVAVGVEQNEPEEVPAELRRSSGESVYRRAHSQRYTTARVLEAEALIRAAGHATGGATVPEPCVDVALLEAVANGVTLNPAQARLVREFATSGARLQLALAPAGTGKTTAMRVLSSAWRDGGGNVVAVGPTHVSVDGLRESMQAEGGTVAALSWALEHGQPLPRWAASINEASLVVVDEAGMAGTFDLATLTAFVMDRGGSVRLIGDNQQLAAVAAGGVLRDLAEASDVPVVSLDEVMRFVDAGEGRATLALRTGDAEALGFYTDRGRVHSVAEATASEAVFTAWQADTLRGWQSLMLASTNVQVTELNSLARQYRISTGEVVDDNAVRLRDGNRAGVGDQIVTRTNDRHLPVSATDWVKNRDRWQVLDVTGDGGLVVQGERHNRVVTLPASYVSASVELGYASTVHAAQGMTVDSSHALISGTETRQSLYVALSRGRHENHVWVSSGAAEESEVWLETTQPSTPVEVLEAVLARDGQAVSATSEVRLAADPARRLAHDSLVWQDSITEAIGLRVAPQDRRRIEAHVAGAIDGAEGMQGWSELTAQLFLLQVRGEDPLAVFDNALAGRDLTDARNPVAVMSRRLERHADLPGGPLPWLWGLPAGVELDESWRRHLELRQARIDAAREELRQQATGWAAAPETAPAWSHPFLTNPELLSDMAEWRAAMDVPAQDLTPLGAPVVFAAGQQHRAALMERVEQHSTRKQRPRWLVPAAVSTDPYWEVVRRRLDAHADAGYPVVSALGAAINAGPLPVEHPAAALWYRVQTGFDDAHRSTTGRRAPLWSDELRQQLPAALVDKASTCPSWGDLAQTLHTAIEDGHDPRHLVTTAAALLPSQVEPEALGALLAARVQDLLQPPGEVIDQLHDPEHDLPFEGLTQTRNPRATTQHAETTEAPTTVENQSDHSPVLEFGPTPKARIVELHEQAAEFYRQRYVGSGAAAYMATRLGTDLTDQPGVVVGYAPAGNALLQQLRSGGATDQELVDAGLAKHGRHGLTDVFRDRLVIGLHDNDGDLVGFVGRAKPDAGPRVPKYLNTPTTRAFSKGEALFGLHEYQNRIADGAELVRVEGPMDALAVTLACQGKAVGVAPLGTALTASQADLIASHTSSVWEATDTDRAGAAAAAKDHTKFIDAGVVAREFILLPPVGDEAPVKDPAELLARPGGAEQLHAALQLGDSAPTLAGRVLARTVQEHSTGLAEGNANVIVATARQAAAVIAPLPPDLWTEHVNLTADLMSDAQDGGDTSWLRELVTAETRSAAVAWQPPAVEDPYRAASSADDASHVKKVTRTGPQQAEANRDALDRAKAVLDRLTKENEERHSPSPSNPEQFQHRSNTRDHDGRGL